jgi:hypothetical protein
LPKGSLGKGREVALLQEDMKGCPRGGFSFELRPR